MTDTTQRNESLRQILNDRRRELKSDIGSRVRNGRAPQSLDGQDAVEQADAGSQAEIEYAFIAMQAASLTRIDRALARLDAGEYGRCSECAGDIAEQRLRALPFASRCRSCEQRREHEQGHLRQLAQGSSLALFSNATGS
jgi:DnaK suppressor protein